MADIDFTKPRTTHIYLQGKAKWFKAHTLNKFGNWSHDIYLTEDSLDQVKKLKAQDGAIKNVLKKDEDGYYMSFNRQPTKLIRGKVIAFHAPEVVKADGTPLTGVLVGNGSDITTKLELYKFKTPTGAFGSAVRWLSTRVDNLIPYEPDTDFDEDTKKAVKGLSEQPEQLF